MKSDWFHWEGKSLYDRYVLISTEILSLFSCFKISLFSFICRPFSQFWLKLMKNQFKLLSSWNQNPKLTNDFLNKYLRPLTQQTELTKYIFTTSLYSIKHFRHLNCMWVMLKSTVTGVVLIAHERRKRLKWRRRDKLQWMRLSLPRVPVKVSVNYCLLGNLQLISNVLSCCLMNCWSAVKLLFTIRLDKPNCNFIIKTWPCLTMIDSLLFLFSALKEIRYSLHWSNSHLLLK